MSGAVLCVECGASSEVSLLVTPLCVSCWRSITNPWRERYGLPPIGRGRQYGPLRPEWGEGWAELRCDLCSYEWVGPVAESCSRCPALLARDHAWQAELVLRPPDVEPDDRNRDDRLRAWAERLARAVKAELISADRARGALEREVQRAAA